MQHTPPYDWLHEFMLQSSKCLWCLPYIYLPIKPYTHSMRSRTMWIKYCNFYCFRCCLNKNQNVSSVLVLEALRMGRRSQSDIWDVFAVCQDFDVMRNEYFMSYETYKIVFFSPFPPPSSHSTCNAHSSMCVLIKSVLLKMGRSCAGRESENHRNSFVCSRFCGIEFTSKVLCVFNRRVRRQQKTSDGGGRRGSVEYSSVTWP